MIHGPVTGGDHGWAFGRPVVDLAEHGYVEDEFFLSGDATTFRPVEGAGWGRDGLWPAEPKGTLPFTTRLLVYRPADPQRFNGTVVTYWNNVTAGYELFHGETPEILEGGYAFVGATAQRVGRAVLYELEQLAPLMLDRPTRLPVGPPLRSAVGRSANDERHDHASPSCSDGKPRLLNGHPVPASCP